MLKRAALICRLLLSVFVAQAGVAQDLSQEADAAKMRLHQRQLDESKKLLDKMIAEKDWNRNTALITYMFGKTYDDQLVQPLIALTDGAANTVQQRAVWLAIGYTQTAAGDAFLRDRRKRGTEQERQLADACMATVELRKRNAQCDLDSDGYIKKLFFSGYNRKLTKEDMSLAARLPAVTTLSIGNLVPGALGPLRRVTTLDFVSLNCETSYIDEAINCLTSSKNITVLNLGGPVTDEAMPDVGSFSSLQCLRLNGSKITDKGLSHIRSLKELSILEIGNTAVTDAGLKNLSGLRNLTNLSLAGTRITGAGLVELQDMEKLWALNLSGTQIDDWSLGNFQEFAGLQSLNFLYLANTHISDAGLKQLSELKNLRGISLGGNERITSQGLSHLNVLANLDWVTCRGGRVSDAAAEEFCADRPDSFYISYTNAPGGPIRHEQSRIVNLNRSPESEWIKKLRRPDRNSQVSQAVIEKIAARGSQVVGPLLAAVKQQHGISHDAARVLHKLGPEIFDSLVDHVRTDSDACRTVSRVFYLHGMTVFPRLRKMLSDNDENVRRVAAEAMQHLLVQSDVEIPAGLDADLMKASSDSNISVRRNVVEMLRRFPDKFATIAPVLMSLAATDPDLSTRMAAISALGNGAVDLPSDDPNFRKTVDLICSTAEHDEFYLRQVSIYCLGKLARKDKQAMVALVRATGDDRESNRRSATQALERLGVKTK